MREILVLRHGMTAANEQRLFTGSQDVPLSDRGIAELAAREGRYPPAVFFFTSGMLRARQTLALLYGEVPSIDIPDLAEINLGRFEGQRHDQLVETDSVYRAWLEDGAEDVICPGGESRRMFRERIQRGWEALAQHTWEGLAVLVTHGGVIHNLLGGAPPTNGCGYRVTLGEAGEILASEAFE